MKAGIVHLIIIVLVGLFSLQCINKENNKRLKNRINGVSFVAPPVEIGQTELAFPKQKVNANFLSIMPYAFISNEGTEVRYDEDWQWWGEKSIGAKATIQLAQKLGYKIMLKPHVWKKHGAYTGEHSYLNKEEWEKFEASFSAYILHYASIAEDLNVSIFCIGTEWKKFVLERPEFWKELINKIRKNYTGKLTYAANWDEYRQVHFWDKLDFIGIDAYFPLSDKERPSEEELIEALIPFKGDMKHLSDSVQSKILFTEYGYRSRPKNASKPWEADRQGAADQEAQNLAYKGFYKSLWEEDFVAGGFLWKWFHNHHNSGGEDHNGFTPQNKKTEKTILKQYSLKASQ